MDNIPNNEDTLVENNNDGINANNPTETNEIDNISNTDIDTSITESNNTNIESDTDINATNIDNATTIDSELIENSTSSPIIENSVSKPIITNDTTLLRKKKRTFPKLFSYIAVGVVCSLLGGVGASAVFLYASPKFSNSITSKGTTAENKSSNKPSNAYLVSTSTTNLSVAEIAKKVGPAVVGVSTKSVGNTPFNQDTEGMGSGIIINKDGYILTNYHVIAGAEQVKVVLSSGKEVSAKIVNYDSASDVAIIKITEKMDMPAIAELGDSDVLEVGEPAIAIGNPLGKELLGSVTVGIISAVNREIAVSDKTMAYIQTDAAINPGNSGGALVNSKGQVIGINTAKIGGSGVEGLGFALPINAIKPKIEALSKQILKIGIEGTDITPEMSKQYNLPIGVYIKVVQDFSAAAKAGLKATDIIVKFDGQNITSINDINSAKGKHKAGDIVKVEIIRDKLSKIISLTLAE